MINVGKCHKCEKTVSSVKVEDVDVVVGFTPRWRGVSFLCPHCSSVLGVGIDPIALKTDIVSEILRGMGR